MPRRTRCTWIVRRGTRCTNKAITKKGLCKMHFRMAIGKPGKVYKDVATTPGTTGGGFLSRTKFIYEDEHDKKHNTNGNNNILSLRSVLEWVINKATVSELETLELVTKNTK